MSLAKQREYFGIGKIDKLKEILALERAKKVFLVTTKRSFSSSSAKERIAPQLKDYQVTIFNEFSQNPKLEDIKRGIKIFKESNSDLIIAIGGGSVIDMAKSINVLSAQTLAPEIYIIEKVPFEKKGCPLVAIPTTSGTGSEATHFAVLYINKSKYSLAHEEYILPNYAIIDPELTFSLPKAITATTGIDVLSQSIESYWSVNSTEEAKAYAQEAIKLVLKDLKTAVNYPCKEARVAMAKAANLSGKAINIAKSTAPHAISYPFTSYFNIPHGHATGLTLGPILVFNANINETNCTDPRGAEYVRLTINKIISFFGSTCAADTCKKIQYLMRDIGLETNIKRLGIDSEEKVNLIIEKGFNPDRIKNNPKRIEPEQLRKILNEISQETEIKPEKMETVYIGMVADSIHHGHINIISEARKLGDVIVGLVTDDAAQSYKRRPILSFSDRARIIKNIKGVTKIVPQNTLDYVPNIEKYKPSIIMHGDDWKKGSQRIIRERALNAVEKYGGRIIDLPYTKGISTTEFIEKVKSCSLNKKNTTQAIILAAGMGTRLRPLTEETPKCLIKVNNKTLLEYSLDCLKENGIQEVIIVIGYRGELIKQKIGNDYHGLKVAYIENLRFSETGSMYSLSLAKKEIKNDILVLESDLLYESSAINTILNSNHRNTMVISKLLHSGDDVYICTNEKEEIINLGKEISEEEKKRAKGAMIGISKYSGEFLAELFKKAEEDYEKGEVNYHYEECVFATSHENNPVKAIFCPELHWIEIDNENDLKKATEVTYPKIRNLENNKQKSSSIKRNILLNPGPATTTDTVKYAQIVPDICPREKEFGDVMKYINNNLIEIAGGNTEEDVCVLFGGSGTAAMDATINSVVPPDKKILVINNGAYGERIAKIARAYSLGCIELKFEWDALPDLKIIEDQLNENPEISCVAMIHHETTTGLLNQVKEIGELVKNHNKVFIVDTISSFAGIPMNIKEFNIDFMMSTSNKCIQGMAGVSFVICSKKQLERIKEYPRRSFYLSLYDQYEYFIKNYQMRFTPPVQTLYALKKAIAEFLEEGYENRVARYTQSWKVLRAGVQELGFKILTQPENESNLLITLLNPEHPNFNFNILHDKLFEKGFTIYPGKVGKVNSFRLSNMGAIDEKDISEFLVTFEGVLNEMGTIGQQKPT